MWKLDVSLDRSSVHNRFDGAEMTHLSMVEDLSLLLFFKPTPRPTPSATPRTTVVTQAPTMSQVHIAVVPPVPSGVIMSVLKKGW